MNNFRIYIVNEQSSIHQFWCFLQQQEGVPHEALANSSASLQVLPFGPLSSFNITPDYLLGADSSPKRVELDARIALENIRDVKLSDLWEVEYKQAHPESPLERHCKSPSFHFLREQNQLLDKVGVQTNNFNKAENQNRGCYANMSFGIQSSNGFMGWTWSPNPGMMRAIVPKLAFYIAVGNFSSNRLTDLENTAHPLARVGLSDFYNLEVTVTLRANGTWSILPGAPSQS